MSKNERVDLRVGRTRRALQHALKELLQEKSYQRITVREIVELGEVARPTFYMHFETKDHLLVSLFSEILASNQEALMNEIRQGSFDRRNFATYLFQTWGDHAQTFRLIFDAGADQILLEEIHRLVIDGSALLRITDGNEVDPFKPYVDDVMAGSLFMVLKRWVQEDMPLPPEALGQLFGDMGHVVQQTVRMGVTITSKPSFDEK